MTLKVRLATMMMLLVMAVLAVQFVLNAREQRDLAERIARINEAVSVSTGDATKMAVVLAGRSDAPALSGLPPEFQVPTKPGTRATLRVIATVRGDSTSTTHDTTVTVEDDGRDIRRIVDSLQTTLLGSEGADGARRIVFEKTHGPNVATTPAGGPGVARSEFIDEEIRMGALRGAPSDSTADRELRWIGDALALHRARVNDAFVFQVPLVFPQRDSLALLEVRYPVDELTDALTRSRRRGFTWMASLLGVGALGAWMMAVQFTRPLRKLEASFRRVERGDLAATVPVGSHDEIGALTASFNHMVTRLSEARTIEQRLTESERLASVGRLAAGVAHEVRNPLNAIQLTMQQLRDRTAPPPDAANRADFERYFAAVTGELRRLERLVSTFLDLSHSGTLPLERLDLTSTVRAAVVLFEHDAAERAVSLASEIREPIWILGDPSRLPTVWNNLLSNALHATAPRGRVVVRAEIERVVTRSPALAEGGPSVAWVHVSVTDDGAGISGSNLARIWEPFYSGRTDGAGLGLSIVKNVVERHGGRVRAASTPGEGTTVVVSFPLAPEERPS